MTKVTINKSFTEVFEEIKNSITLSKKGKPIVSFSRGDFDKLTKAFLNEINYKVETVSNKANEIVTKEVFPVQLFRNMIKTILLDFGVDAQEAQRVVESYEFRNTDGFYEVCSEIIYKYADTGRKFDFIPKADFNGSIVLKDVAEFVGEYTNIQDGTKINIRKEAHKLLKAKSRCPKGKKHRINT